ncbi:beta-ketoacyl-[acyl-carrier-protein] synthase family protein [Aquimarina sediminis]|uniref:beta-ketoacyl-[acyl-carrier-protein] synthase family protein n=1 Tax=Aquimarina sediminis TaxID=2070536 RepID=UPI000CA00DF3|nr:beta-ketoacyl synthase N-terminal-like domain-containing protein [Aquimarina sediminis]
MRSVFITADNIVSPLGFTSVKNIAQIAQEQTGIALHSDIAMSASPFYASIIKNDTLEQAFRQIDDEARFTKLEKMMLLSLQDTISKASFSITNKTALVISTTKGNIDVLHSEKSVFSPDRAYLPVLGNKIKTFFGFKNDPIIVSNACVSGILAVAVAKRLIQSNFYDNAFVVSGDIVSEFTLSGFNAFQAISNAPCQPFSKNRKGITIGEAAASVAITTEKETNEVVEIIGDGSCNDANHISGPSRNGEGLYKSIQSAIKEADIQTENIDYISAHGTATLYNDEMEAIAVNRANLGNTPINSLKGYYGHTLGASGLLETIVGLHTMKNNTLYTSIGIDELGVSEPINIIKSKQSKDVNTFLKTASGFGGCNTAVLFKKHNI